MKCSIKDFFSKCDQICCSFLRIWSHLLKKFLTENFSFCGVLLNHPHQSGSPITNIFQILWANINPLDITTSPSFHTLMTT